MPLAAARELETHGYSDLGVNVDISANGGLVNDSAADGAEQTVLRRRNVSHRTRKAAGIKYEIAKRAVDICGSAALLIMLAPVLLITALVVRFTSAGPVIFKQNRLTQGGRIFTMFKFRTMVQDAEDLSGAVWASDKDPRVTPLGKFLRQTRIDELPQLFNVLIGDMSLVGPRPERPEFAEKLSLELPSFDRRLEVKAGITGLAQVGNGYAACMSSYRKKLALDLIYVQNRGALLDLRIALKTVLVVLTGSGAR